jgi:hypothetical protein
MGDREQAGFGDYKRRAERTDVSEQMLDEDKRHLQSNPHDQPMIPEESVNPAARELHERKEAGRRDDQGGMSDDERVDEASEESFPASDPPSQP